MTGDNAESGRLPAAGKDRREIEWQMVASNLEAVRRWLSGHTEFDGMSIEPCQTQHIRDTYLDTDDWRIFRAGYALRRRLNQGRNEVTLKSLRSRREDVADRRELSEPLQTEELDGLFRSSGPVGSRIHAVTAGHSLRPLFEVRTRRERFALRSDGGSEELAEIALDESLILQRDGEPSASCQRVEVEALGERHRALAKFVELLGAGCGLESARQSKYELGLTSVGLAPPTAPQLAPVDVDASMHASEVALARIRKLFTSWFANEPGARLGDDPERLHDLRTATRRIDATIGLFAEYLPQTLVRARPRVKALVRTLGAVRDFDVQLATLAEFARELCEEDRDALKPLLRHLESGRAKARSHMLKELDSKSTRRWLDEFMTTLAQPSSSSESRNDGLAAVVVPGMIERSFRKLRKSYRQLTEDSSVEEYHDCRGRAKKLRYAIESVAPLYGKAAEQMLRWIRRLQNELGEQQDAHVSEQRLLALASGTPEELPSRTVFLMGRLAEQCAAASVGARNRLGRRWRKVRGRRWKELRSQMRGLRARSTTAEPVAKGEPTPLRDANGKAIADEGLSETSAANEAPAVESASR